MIAIALQLLPRAALAGDCAVTFRDSERRLSVAERELGAQPDWEAVRAASRNDPTCHVRTLPESADCEYRDAGNVLNLVYGRAIVRQRLSGLQPEQSITGLRLKAGDTMASVLARFHQEFPTFPHWTILSVPDGLTITTGNCLIGESGRHWAFTAQFDNDHRLTGIEARLEW